MKKIIALMMCVAMLTVTLAGCSEAELGFLEQLREQRTITEGTFSNQLELYINKAAMQGFLSDVKGQMEEAYESLAGVGFAEPEWWEDSLDEMLEDIQDVAVGALDPALEEELEQLLIKFGTEDQLTDEEFVRLEELLYGDYDDVDIDYGDYGAGNSLATWYYGAAINAADSALRALDALEDEEFRLVFDCTVERRRGEVRGMKMTAGLTVNGKAIDLGDLYLDSSHNLYLSARTISGCREIASLAGLDELLEPLLEPLEIIAKERQYICIEEDFSFLYSMESIYGDNVFTGLLNAATDFYAEAFSGFTTGRIRKMRNGYELEVSVEDAAKLLDKSMEYAMNNESQFFEAYDKYIFKLVNLFQSSGFSSAWVDVPGLTDSEKAEFRQSMEEARGTVRDQLTSSWMKSMGRSGIRVFLKTSGGRRESELEMNFYHNRTKTFSLSVSSVATEGRPEIRYPGKYIAGDELYDRLEILERDLNPAVGAEMYFDFYDGEEDPEKELAVWQLLSTDFGDYYEMDYMVIDGEYYVPLRAISEPLRLELEYDPETKRSQPVIEGKAVQLEGIVDNSVLYVALKDFAQLGYLVEAMDDGYGGVVILNKKEPAWEEWYDYLLSGW